MVIPFAVLPESRRYFVLVVHAVIILAVTPDRPLRARRLATFALVAGFFMRGRMVGMIPVVPILGIVLFIGGLGSILFADDWVRHFSDLYSVKTVRVIGWVEIAIAIVLIGGSLWVKVSEEFNFPSTH